jgi:hypothetical protein
MSNLAAVFISFVYVFAMLGIAEDLRRALKLEVEFTRKLDNLIVPAAGALVTWAFLFIAVSTVD